MLIFTAREPELWGTTGGWDCLTNLCLWHVIYLSAFIGKTPVLKEVAITVDTGEDFEKLASQFQSADLSSPFGLHLSIIHFFGPLREYWQDTTGVLQKAQKVPWWLLKPPPANITALGCNGSGLILSCSALILSAWTLQRFALLSSCFLSSNISAWM